MGFGEFILSKKLVYRWHNLFTEGREDVNNYACAERPSTSTTDENDEAVKKIVMESGRMRIKDVAECVSISGGQQYEKKPGIVEQSVVVIASQ